MQRQGGRKALSPTAQLLRSSRLFSIPELLPRPHVGPPTKGSHNSTLPYPIRQAITAPPSSVARGDFGLKRNLPLKRLAKTKNPIVRIVDLDTIEHVTDYEFAADHTQTLKKVQEMNLASSYHPGSRYATGGLTVGVDAFDESVDNTHLTPGQDQLGISRWRQGEGTLVNTTETQFERLLKARAKTAWEQKRAQRSIQEDVDESHLQREQQAREDSDTIFSREWSSQSGQIRKEFMAGCRDSILADHQSIIRRRAMDEGRDVDPKELELDEQDYEERMRELLDEYRVNAKDEQTKFDSTLHRYIGAFLDLPKDIIVPDPSAASGRVSNVFASPRSTHPSAGLTYLRSHAILENHPTYGPLKNRTPVESRVLQHATNTGKGNHFSIFGIAGVVMRVDHYNSNQEPSFRRGSFDFEEVGGSKVWVHPTRLNIDNDGKIRMHADQAEEGVAVAIKKGEITYQDMTHQTTRQLSRVRNEMRTTLDTGRRRQPQHKTGYGIEEITAKGSDQTLLDFSLPQQDNTRTNRV